MAAVTDTSTLEQQQTWPILTPSASNCQSSGQTIHESGYSRPFSLRNVTSDDTKYHYVVAALDQSTALRVIDILEDPPQTGKYANLKKRLTDIFGLSQRQRADRLLDVKCLGDRASSQLMDEMLALLGDHKPCMLFESLFLRCMPDDIRLQLVSNSFADMRTLAKCADALWQTRGQTEVPSSTSNVTDENHVEGRSPRDLRSRTTTTPKSFKPSSNTRDTDICYYHRRFGNAARRCNGPCIFSGNERAGRQ